MVRDRPCDHGYLISAVVKPNSNLQSDDLFLSLTTMSTAWSLSVEDRDRIIKAALEGALFLL